MPRSLKIFAAMLLFFSLRAEAYLDETQIELIPISLYKPTFILLGTPDTKVQLSLKGQIVQPFPIYLTYTQLMFWDLFKYSAPFRDIDYNPEIFYRWAPFSNPRSWLDIGILEHESNGKDGNDTRSWNRSYLRYSGEWNLNERMRLNFSAKAWVPYATSENPDIAKYRGLAEFTIALAGFLGPFFERDDLILRFYLGGATYVNPLQGGQELTFRAKSKGRAFLPLIVLQAFHGYGESLLEYRDQRTGIRIGMGL